MERPEAGWGTWLLGKASTSWTPTAPTPRMLPAQAKATEWPFVCWGQCGAYGTPPPSLMENRASLWTGGRPGTSVWYRAASPPCCG